jgi:hypothetical protein
MEEDDELVELLSLPMLASFSFNSEFCSKFALVVASEASLGRKLILADFYYCLLYPVFGFPVNFLKAQADYYLLFLSVSAISLE